MPFHFTQEIRVRKTGFGNGCTAELGVPTPIAGEFLEGSTLYAFDQHPYLGTSGWGNLDGSDYPEEVVQSCSAALIVHYKGLTKCPMSADFSEEPTFWGIAGLDRHPGVSLEPAVLVNSKLNEVSYEVEYDSTSHVAFDLSRVAFQWVKVERDGEIREFRNVACLPLSPWRNAATTYRMWGQTYSWGSEQEKYLTIPAREIRLV